MQKWIDKLEKLDPCPEAIEWARTQPDPQTLWNNCERGDWMLWLVGKLGGGARTKSRKTLVLAACECARLSLPYVKKGEERPLKAIETAEAWIRGEAKSREVLAAAATAAADAAAGTGAGAGAYAAVAAYAAIYAAAAATANAAAAAVCGADAAVYGTAASSAAAYAVYAADAATKTDVLRKCADIAHKYYPKVPKL